MIHGKKLSISQIQKKKAQLSESSKNIAVKNSYSDDDDDDDDDDYDEDACDSYEA